MRYYRLKIAISFISRATHYEGKYKSVCVCETHPWKNYLKEGLLTDQQKFTLDLSMRSFRYEYELNYAP